MACAMTGSGKTVAFLLPVLNQLMGRTRGTTRALVLTPTRELAAQILEDLNDLAVHTPLSAAAVFGGVGMGPQEHAFRSGVDVLIATPGRLLDHFNYPYAKLRGLEMLVLDEADRMLDMGSCPTSGASCGTFLRGGRRCSFPRPCRCRSPSSRARCSRTPWRSTSRASSARGRSDAGGVSGGTGVEVVAPGGTAERGDLDDALVFTRTKHRADRLADFLVRRGIGAERIHGNRSQNQRTLALAGFKSGKHRVLVATDIAARGIDVEALGHVINFDVPKVPEDYIHRVGGPPAPS